MGNNRLKLSEIHRNALKLTTTDRYRLKWTETEKNGKKQTVTDHWCLRHFLNVANLIQCKSPFNKN